MTEPPPKRDKFASMAAAQQQQAPPQAAAAPKRDKFASMASSQQQAPQPQQATTTSKEKDDNNTAEIQQRMKQRDKVLQDLQQAEAWTWNLLNLASETAESLSNISSGDTQQQDVSLYSKQYRETLEKLHGILTPHASLVVAYENHSADETNNKRGDVNMYAARVEMRLAQERQTVLQELLKLEQEEATTAGSSTSNAKEQETAVASAPGEKRKRQE